MQLKRKDNKKKFKNKQTAIEQEPFKRNVGQYAEQTQGGDDKRGPLDIEARDTNTTTDERIKLFLVLLVGVVSLGIMGCKPQTTGQKIEDKVEDAGHEMKQGAERAKENVQDAR